MRSTIRSSLDAPGSFGGVLQPSGGVQQSVLVMSLLEHSRVSWEGQSLCLWVSLYVFLI